MKIKIKLKAALTAAFSCLTLIATMNPASAYQGSNGGLASANWSDTNPPIGYATGVDSFAWRADLPWFSAYIRIVKRFNNFKRNATPKCATSI